MATPWLLVKKTDLDNLEKTEESATCMTKDLNQKIYVAGHRGMVGSAIVRTLEARGFTNIITKTHAQLELEDQSAVKSFFETEKPDQVYLAAARVGGIYANNTYPAAANVGQQAKDTRDSDFKHLPLVTQIILPNRDLGQ